MTENDKDIDNEIEFAAKLSRLLDQEMENAGICVNQDLIRRTLDKVAKDTNTTSLNKIAENEANDKEDDETNHRPGNKTDNNINDDTKDKPSDEINDDTNNRADYKANVDKSNKADNKVNINKRKNRIIYYRTAITVAAACLICAVGIGFIQNVTGNKKSSSYDTTTAGNETSYKTMLSAESKSESAEAKTESAKEDNVYEEPAAGCENEVMNGVEADTEEESKSEPDSGVMQDYSESTRDESIVYGSAIKPEKPCTEESGEQNTGTMDTTAPEEAGSEETGEAENGGLIQDSQTASDPCIITMSYKNADDQKTMAEIKKLIVEEPKRQIESIPEDIPEVMALYFNTASGCEEDYIIYKDGSLLIEILDNGTVKSTKYYQFLKIDGILATLSSYARN